MATLAEQQTRIQLLLQEVDASPTRQQQLAVAHQEALAQLARARAFGTVAWIQAVAGQALYSVPTETVEIVTVLYNDRRLDYARETQLDRWQAGWEALSGEPQYYTYTTQSPNVIRVVPHPVRTGSAIPTAALVPMVMPTEDNLVVLVTVDVSAGITDPEDTIPCRAGYDDWLVYETTRALASREVDTQNLPLAALCQQLADLWLSLLRGPSHG